jgi:hypothetical protein
MQNRWGLLAIFLQYFPEEKEKTSKQPINSKCILARQGNFG